MYGVTGEEGGSEKKERKKTWVRRGETSSGLGS
jgi:hypothetical protein